MSFGWLGKKYDDFINKKREGIRGGQNGGKEEIFAVLGKKISVWKGGGQKYKLFGKYTLPLKKKL